MIYDYLKQYQEDPTSRVFAPLAEAYRKSGMVEQAEQIAREGLLVHPDFVGGKVALARALADQRKHQEVVEVLEGVVKDAPDNRMALRILADAYVSLGNPRLALNHLKMLLFLSPHDTELSGQVSQLEGSMLQQGELELIAKAEAFQELQLGEELKEETDPKSAHARVEHLHDLLKRVERYRVLYG